MLTIPDMIRSGTGEFSSSSLLRDGVSASGPTLFSNDRLAAADRIDSLEDEIKYLQEANNLLIQDRQGTQPLMFCGIPMREAMRLLHDRIKEGL
jgi:hypothetical protein